jgi:L-asparaginase
VKVAIITTGGTIASRRDELSGQVAATASGPELLSQLHDRSPVVETELTEFCNLNSYLFDLKTAYRLARCVDQILARPDILGAVVTHGTDTMEESAYMTDLLVDCDKPVVFTGAQRTLDEPDGDGPRNLVLAIRLAAAAQARGLGAMILFDHEFHAARDATKAHSYRVGAFHSAEHGKLGEVDGERVIVHRQPRLRRHFAVDRIEPRVDLVKLVIGSDARFMRCAVESGARGLVIEAFGRGNANHGIVAATRAAVEAGVEVVITSRCPYGRVEPIYGNGGGEDLAKAGAIFAGDLTGIKARVLLSVLLGRPQSHAGLEETIHGLCG